MSNMLDSNVLHRNIINVASELKTRGFTLEEVAEVAFAFGAPSFGEVTAAIVEVYQDAK
jgi:hypothetical protein